MPRDAARHQLDAARDLLQRLHRRVLHLAADADDAAAFGNAVLGVDQRELLLHQVADADAGAAFLAGFRDEDHVARERHVQPLQQQHRHQRRGEVVLVIDRAAAVDVAAVAGRAQRRELPLRVVGRHHVAVAHDEQRPLAAVALQPGDEVGPFRIGADDLRRDAFLLEHLLEVLDQHGFVAGRIAGVDAQHRLVVLHRLVLQFRPVRLRRGLGEQACGCGKKKKNGEPAEGHRPSWKSEGS